MTLIITQISKHGIVHASDSNLSDSNGKTVGTAQKTFLIPKLNAGLTVAGAFGVGPNQMNDWMNAFISKSVSTSLEGFAEELRISLETNMTDEQKLSGSLMHISGYAEHSGKYHPEFWFVRNVYKMDGHTGEYSDIRKQFVKSEDFWNRDNLTCNLFKLFQSDNSAYQLYINGFTPGRISYNIIQSELNNFFYGLWANKDWKFRAPNNIDEAKELVKNYMIIINSTFLLSDYPGQYIGGNIQVEVIPQPSILDL